MENDIMKKIVVCDDDTESIDLEMSRKVKMHSEEEQ